MVKNRLINNASITVNATSTEISKALYGAEGKRIVLALTNTSTAGEVISIAIGQEAVAGKGIVLGQGASYVASMDGSYIPPQDMVKAIESAGTGTLAIYEEIEMEYN